MIEVGEIKVPPALLSVPEVITSIVPDLVEAVRAHLIHLAHTRLHTSSQDYVLGIQPPIYHHPAGHLPMDGPTKVATIVLVGQLPNMIEQGWPGGDMKPFLLAGRNAKVSASGSRYNTVPFRQGTPGTTGRNFMPMGSQFRGALHPDEVTKMGKKIYNRAKKLSPTTQGRHGTRWGDRLPKGLAPKLRSHHRTDVFAGMVRQQAQYAKSQGSQYTTFRRVSDNSDPRAWVHPGIEGARLFSEAATFASSAAARLIAEVSRG